MVLRSFLLIILLFFSIFSFSSCSDQARSSSNGTGTDPSEIKLLVFTKTEGYRHASIPDGIAALQQIASENGWNTDHTEDASVFTSDSLNTYRAVIFLNTTGDILNSEQQSAFEEYIQNGSGFIGIHSASDTEYDWPWYGRLVGAYFESHPQIQEAGIKVTDRNHPSTQMLPAEWIRTDEWYNFRDISPDINVLMQLDESSYEGGTNGDYHPIAWYHEQAGGRMFYTAGGHTSESYAEELFLQHLQGGITYVIGNS